MKRFQGKVGDWTLYFPIFQNTIGSLAAFLGSTRSARTYNAEVMALLNGSFFRRSIWWPGCFIQISWVASKSVVIQKVTNIAMENPHFSWRIPSKRCIFHCHVRSRSPFNWGLRPGGMVQVKGLKGDAVGDAQNRIQVRPSVWTSRILGTTFFLQKLRSTYEHLELLKVTFDFPPWVKSKIAWSVMAEALRLNDEKGVGTPKESLDWRDPKNRVVCSGTRLDLTFI